MFSKPPTPNVERRTKEITYDFTYESLFQFIKKNTILKNKINEIESNSE